MQLRFAKSTFANSTLAFEEMNNFLVREALGYSEFVEALLLLYGDKQGVKQHEKAFGLPEEVPRDE